MSKGRQEGLRSLVAKQLALKFGALDHAAEARLATATATELERWAERLLTATSVAEVLG